jgi:hypothetical protein
MLTASGESPIHELQHLHWNYLLVKILAFEPTTNRKLFSHTSNALVFESDDNGIWPPDLCRTTSPTLKSVFIECFSISKSREFRLDCIEF